MSSSKATAVCRRASLSRTSPRRHPQRWRSRCSAVFGAVGLAGAWGAGRIGARVGLGRTLIGSLAVAGLGCLMIPLAHSRAIPSLAALGLGCFLMGFGMFVYNVTQVSLRQSMT